MSKQQKTAYAFEESLPVEPVEPGTNLLVTGPSLGGLRELVMGLLACQESEGLLLLTTDTNGPDAIADYEADGCPYEVGRMAVVDCTSDGTENDQHNIYSVGDPGDLTGMGIVFSSLYEQLYDADIERVRTGLYTLSTMLMYTEKVQPLYRFLHTFNGRIRQADGLGISAVDPKAQDTRTFKSISQPFDGQIQLRKENGESQLRVRGLKDQPDGWQPLDL